MMTKKDIAEIVASQQGITKKEAADVVHTVLETIGSSLARGEKVSLVGFGTFDVRERSERVGRNPQTGEVIQIKASKTPVFKAGKDLKDLVK